MSWVLDLSVKNSTPMAMTGNVQCWSHSTNIGKLHFLQYHWIGQFFPCYWTFVLWVCWLFWRFWVLLGITVYRIGDLLTDWENVHVMYKLFAAKEKSKTIFFATFCTHLCLFSIKNSKNGFLASREYQPANFLKKFLHFWHLSIFQVFLIFCRNEPQSS